MKEFFKTKLGIQLYSFIKTYITVFLGLYLFQFDGAKDIALLDLVVIGSSAKWALIAVLRNIYKLLTEKK